MRPLTLALILGAILSIAPAFAQQHICGSEQLHGNKMQSDPGYRLKMDDFEAYIQSPQFLMRQNYTVGGVTVYRIPLVFHVMHKGEAIGVGTNISKDDILNSVKALNSRYRKVLGGIGDGNGVDINIEFSLAVRDPNGNCTDAILRYDMSGNAAYMSYGVNSNNTNGIDDAALKALSFWDSHQYYNVWVISEIDDNNGGSGIQGYAYFAGAHGSSIDGAVMLAKCISDTTTITLAHELGHALNLYHTFEGDVNGTTCPPNADCTTDGDRVCDTPPHIRSASNCVTGANACDGGSARDLFIHNYMDYSADYCQNEFTAGQKPRMTAALTGTRASLLTENGNLSLTPPSTAAIDFIANKSLVCSGATVQFFDRSLCSPNNYIKSIGWPGITFSWTLTNNSGTTLTSTDQNPVFTLTVAGTYDATLVITNANGSSSGTKQGVIIVTAAPIAPTCTGSNSSPGTNIGYGIYEVYLNTLAHTSGGTYDDIQSGLTNATGYGDFSCTASTILKANTAYTISIQGTSNNGGGTVSENFNVYIDYNNDGDFLDAGELVASITNVPGGSGLQNLNFTTPAAPTLNVPLRMRVFSSRASETISSACFVTTRGQIQDYAVIISNKIASVTIAASPSTTISYGTNVTFTATPVNGGTTPTYKWYLNGVVQTGFTGPTYTNNTLLNGDQIYCVMTSNLANVIASPATSNTLSMIVTGPPLTDFTENKTSLCAGGTVVYTDRSLLSPTSWAWTFAGGTPGTSAAQNPTITYNTAGTYNTTLTASNAYGTGTTKTYTNLINVFAVPASICSGFTRSTTPAAGIGILRVTMNTIDNATAYNDAVFIDNVCTMVSTLTPGSTYSISVQGGSSNPQWVRVYIDYNANNVFTDAGETIFAPTTGPGTLSGSFTVPLTATTNQLVRMRVISDFVNTTPGSCTTPLQYGQVEDYGIVISGGALPISLISLTAQRVGSQQAMVNWDLGMYSEVYAFYIERSTDGSHYTAIDSIHPSHSSSAARTHYSIVDYTAPASIAYYRLKTKYTNGSNEISYAVTIPDLNAAENNIYVYPVPVTQNEIKVFYGNTTGDVQWELNDVNGKSISKGVLHTSEQTDEIHISEISNGVYILRLSTGSQTYVQRITVLR